MQGSRGRRKPRANSKHCRGSYPVVTATKINRNDLGTARSCLLLAVGFFFSRYIGPHPATKPHKANRGDGLASGVAEIPTTSGFGPRHHWRQKFRFLAPSRSLDSLKALPWRGSPKLSVHPTRRGLRFTDFPAGFIQTPLSHPHCLSVEAAPSAEGLPFSL